MTQQIAGLIARAASRRAHPDLFCHSPPPTGATCTRLRAEEIADHGQQVGVGQLHRDAQSSTVWCRRGAEHYLGGAQLRKAFNVRLWTQPVDEWIVAGLIGMRRDV